MRSLVDLGRIRGIEVEHQALVTINGKTQPEFFMAPERQNVFFEKLLPPELTSSWLTPMVNWLFLANGAKIGIDSGWHPEYATQEVDCSLVALSCEKAGENIMAGIAKRANEYWKEYGITVRFFKNNLDASGHADHSCGMHESYMFLRDEDKLRMAYVVELLWPHLVSRSFYTGNGWVDKELSFHISQRAKAIEAFLTGATTSKRPIVNTRDEPHADAEKYRRIHIIVGDSLMADTAIYLRSGTTALILDMIEEGFLTECPFRCENDERKVKILHDFSQDITLRKPVKFDSGNYTMVDVQEWYFERAQEYCEKTGRMSGEREDVLRRWGDRITYARSDDPVGVLSSCVDWAAKKCLIEEDMKRYGYGFNTPPDSEITVLKRDPKTGKRKEVRSRVFDHLKALDLKFLELGAQGYMQKLIETGFIERLATDEMIRAVEYGPVPDLRSCARADAWQWYVAEAQRRGRVLTEAADWMYFAAKDGDERIERFGKMKDPYESRLKLLSAPEDTDSQGPTEAP